MREVDKCMRPRHAYLKWSQRVNIVPVFFFAKEVSTVLSQWLSSTPPERKRIPRKPTEASYSQIEHTNFQSKCELLGIMQ